MRAKSESYGTKVGLILHRETGMTYLFFHQNKLAEFYLTFIFVYYLSS